ncbi:hypothetical protein Tco_1109208 [Tanacetum coccineum]
MVNDYLLLLYCKNGGVTYRGTSELVEDSKEDDDEVDEEIEESMDSDSVSEDIKDKGPTIEDEDPAARDEGLTTRVEGPSMDDEGYGLDDESRCIDEKGHSVESDELGLEEEEEAVLGGQQQAAPVVGTAMNAPLGLRYGALRRHELALEEGDVYSMFEVGQGSGSAPEFGRPDRVSAFRQPTLSTWTDPEDDMIYIDIPNYPPPAPPLQTPPSPEWTSSSLHISPSHSDVPSPISSPMTPLTVPSPVATPTAIKTEGFLTELGAQVEMQGGLIHDHVHAINDVQGENRDLRLHLAEERRARLELAEVVDGMRRGQESEGGHCMMETDISQKDEKPSKKRQNQTRDGKVCEDEAQSKSRADYANLGNFIYKRKKGEKGNEKKKDVEGLFLYKNQTYP